MVNVSVLMCVYNTDIDYLKESIESILSQTYKEFEFIIVDDGSNVADVKKILKEYEKKDNRIKLFANQTNIGLTKSLNVGLKHCSGKYIVRMDSDDVSEPNRLSRQFEYMEQNPEIDVLGTQVRNFGIEKIYLPPFKNYMDNPDVFKVKMLFNNLGPRHPSVIIRNAFLQKNNIQYREEIKKAQDYALWMDCIIKNGKIACMEDVLLNYRIHKNQITIGESEEQIKCRQEISRESILQMLDVSYEVADVLSTLYFKDYKYSTKDYIKSIKSAEKRNKIYNKKILKDELRQRWIHKVFKTAIVGKDFRGFLCCYTYKCIFSTSFLGWLKDEIFNRH